VGERIVSRATIIDRATLYVTESTGDFATTVLSRHRGATATRRRRC
jgi:hypothetical protein